MDALQTGESVELRGFGRFHLRHRPPRAGRNPRTGEAIPIPAKAVPTFTAGDACHGSTGLRWPIGVTSTRWASPRRPTPGVGYASGAAYQQARERREAMAQSTEPLDTAVDLQVVREFLERYFTTENEMKVLQQ